ncbi:DUF1392 family protein [Nostoc sp. 'Peltigera malacea cyanobiont' DB3992]|uniref:DUF1392 family protein n=1 Tax=Nostoc sp. 'Peltigera malacea cyanobiont' DB3992 TaxID=1206980 RepID=UPI00117EB2C2
MTNLVQNLEQCWYISAPWVQRIPPLLVSLLERVYVKSAKAFGYCCIKSNDHNTVGKTKSILVIPILLFWKMN